MLKSARAKLMTKAQMLKQIDALASQYLGAPSHIYGLSHKSREELQIIQFTLTQVASLASQATALAEANGVEVVAQTWLILELAADRPAWANEALALRYQANCLYLGMVY